MASLIYYRKEREEFDEAFKKELSICQAEIIYKKLCKHFKLRMPRLVWTSGRNHPHCSQWSICLNYNYNTIGVICHELAHLFMFQKLNTHGHNKKHKRIMKRMIRYCEKKNWFEAELKRRTEPKPQKPEPTKQEIQQQKITKAEKKMKRYEMKIKMYQKKLSKANKSLTILKKRCSSSLD